SKGACPFSLLHLHFVVVIFHVWKISVFMVAMYNFQVREMVSVLDLDVLFYPCPQKGPTFRPKVLEMGGKKQFPYMVCKNSSPVLLFVRLYVIATISSFIYLSYVVSELCLTNKHDPRRITIN
uniref:Uncharacterized protein n=1 Tax=Aegilops tauschii subsp. strangulata TaxID=200361 RepID=A0A453QHZ6_AEGTS